VHNALQVSVLDIFGFEVFQTNHFEQFCINYANEKLQLHFNHFNFMLERALYAREGIELVESDFVDNSACVALIEVETRNPKPETCRNPKR
jgi:myosin heavy subunit